MLQNTKQIEQLKQLNCMILGRVVVHKIFFKEAWNWLLIFQTSSFKTDYNQNIHFWDYFETKSSGEAESKKSGDNFSQILNRE